MTISPTTVILLALAAGAGGVILGAALARYGGEREAEFCTSGSAASGRKKRKASKMTGPVDWPTLILIVGAIVISGGIILSMVRWVYADSNNTRAEISRVASELRDNMSRVREDIANRYVSVETHSLVTKTVERAIEDLKTENRNALNALADRIDTALIALTTALKPPQK